MLSTLGSDGVTELPKRTSLEDFINWHWHIKAYLYQQEIV